MTLRCSLEPVLRRDSGADIVQVEIHDIRVAVEGVDVYLEDVEVQVVYGQLAGTVSDELSDPLEGAGDYATARTSLSR